MIYTLTLNPAIDKILFIDSFQKSRTNRVNRQIETLGGKGTHVSVNLRLLGVDSVALGVTFGENGKKIAKMMVDNGAGERFLHYDTPGWQSRTNVILIEESDRSCSMITERGPRLNNHITNALIAQIESLIQEDDFLVLTGGANNVDDTEIYSKISRKARDRGVRVVLDASGDYLKEGIKSVPYFIKPNYEELCYVAGKELKTDDEIILALEDLSMSGIEIIALTLSGKGALVKFGNEVFQVNPVSVNVVNEIGCGDAFLSAILACLVKGMSRVDTLKLASSVAGATAENELTMGFDVTRAYALAENAIVTKIL